MSYPDEIMIDWGKTPRVSVANIYWPGAAAASVLQLAQQLYPVQALSVADANTVQCQVVSAVTYIPIPRGDGGSFAGLLSIDLPATVRYGNEFDIVVRRITTKQLGTLNPKESVEYPQDNMDEFPSSAIAGYLVYKKELVAKIGRSRRPARNSCNCWWTPWTMENSRHSQCRPVMAKTTLMGNWRKRKRPHPSMTTS